MAAKHFRPELFGFLNQLSANNNRQWFTANKDYYESSVRQPALEFITDFADRLNAISPHFVADSRTVGGSLFRINRDTRFSKDKTPYKTNTGIHFRHEAAKDAHAPGFYLHLQPRKCFFGAGLWHPESKVAYAIREHIDENRSEWTGATSGSRFAERLTLVGDSLKRTPKGFDDDHPLIADLMRKDFIATTDLTQGDITKAGFIDEFADLCDRTSPLMSELCKAVGVNF